MSLSWNLSLLKIHFLLGASVTWMWSESKLGCSRRCSYSYYFFHYCKLLWACKIETAIDKHAIIFSLSPWSLTEIRTWCSIFVLDREKQGGVNGGEKGFKSCNDMQGKKISKPKGGPHIRQWWHAALRGFSVKGTSANFICEREKKACTFKILVVSFLNQGHLFLGGKREMFLKARLSIKSIGCYGDHLPHRTALCVRLCDFLYSKVCHCQKTN